MRAVMALPLSTDDCVVSQTQMPIKAHVTGSYYFLSLDMNLST